MVYTVHLVQFLGYGDERGRVELVEADSEAQALEAAEGLARACQAWEDCYAVGAVPPSEPRVATGFLLAPTAEG